ncbi:hypothetical protein BO99DRAFT_127117 [Aspergillus violaceofuscus CBS 115571]|uniref:Uncharacterized protein n=1 Tax=Aspergillus violaceofuscus (strain CBS 115571) TaxID=1450538 RepID=A0A2V5HI79_ASPV1|nr:hypothetical protein BO99DRAFT_127117 [Aspergillus violaceofuscus CBS 115571]
MLLVISFLSFGGPGPCEPLKLPTRARPPGRERFFCFWIPVILLAGLQSYADCINADNAVQPAHCLATRVVVGYQLQQSLLLCPLSQWLAIGTAAVHLGNHLPLRSFFHHHRKRMYCFCGPCNCSQGR